jgi:hypothetical protein
MLSHLLIFGFVYYAVDPIQKIIACTLFLKCFLWFIILVSEFQVFHLVFYPSSVDLSTGREFSHVWFLCMWISSFSGPFIEEVFLSQVYVFGTFVNLDGSFCLGNRKCLPLFFSHWPCYSQSTDNTLSVCWKHIPFLINFTVYWIFTSCLNSSARCKNQGNFQDHFSDNLLGAMTQIPDLMSVSSRIFCHLQFGFFTKAFTIKLPENVSIYVHIWWTVLVVYYACWLHLPLSQIIGQTWILKGDLSSSMATHRQKNQRLLTCDYIPCQQKPANDGMLLLFSLKDFRVSSPWMGNDRCHIDISRGQKEEDRKKSL